MIVSRWPKDIFIYTENHILYISVPFTWLMPRALRTITFYAYSSCFKEIQIGGPGCYLALHYYPDFLRDLPVKVGYDLPGILQRINPLATRTTTGCIRKCQFCGIGCGVIEPGGIVELDDWLDLPIIIDNNVLAATIPHFDKVIDRLIPHGWADFEQGLDARKLTEYHAQRIAEIKEPMVRLALDSMSYRESWEEAYEKLRSAGIRKRQIRSYALIAFDSDPIEAWERCNFIESKGIRVLPMWYHSLDCLKANSVSDAQTKLGWNDYERRRIMQWFYKHKKAVK
jgi:hypothetical protein